VAEQLLQPSYEIHVCVKDEVCCTVAIFEEDKFTAACVVGIRDTSEKPLYTGLLQIGIEALEAARFSAVKAKDAGYDGQGQGGQSWTDAPPF